MVRIGNKMFAGSPPSGNKIREVNQAALTASTDHLHEKYQNLWPKPEQALFKKR